MDSLERSIYLADLYELYKDLLTNKQQTYFYDYYFLNLSLQEIASEYNLSRNAIYDQIRHAENKLEEIEKVVKLRSKITTIEELDIDDSIKDKILDIIKE